MVALRMDELVLTSNDDPQREEFVLNSNHYSPTICYQYS